MLFSISVVGCSSNISSKDINEMKEIVDKVLSYENSYDDEVSNYIDEDTFNEAITKFFTVTLLEKLNLLNMKVKLRE